MSGSYFLSFVAQISLFSFALLNALDSFRGNTEAAIMVSLMFLCTYFLILCWGIVLGIMHVGKRRDAISVYQVVGITFIGILWGGLFLYKALAFPSAQSNSDFVSPLLYAFYIGVSYPVVFYAPSLAVIRYESRHSKVGILGVSICLTILIFVSIVYVENMLATWVGLF